VQAAAEHLNIPEDFASYVETTSGIVMDGDHPDRPVAFANWSLNHRSNASNRRTGEEAAQEQVGAT
jgi:hypothetical protein